MLKGWLVVLMGVILVGCGEQPADARVGRDLSALAFTTLDGEAQPLSDAVLFEKKPVLLNMWATWCPPCLAEMPRLDALGKAGTFTVVAVATDESATVVKEFLKKQNWGRGVQVWHDPQGRVAREKLGVRAYPTSFVLDARLKVLRVVDGEWTE